MWTVLIRSITDSVHFSIILSNRTYWANKIFWHIPHCFWRLHSRNFHSRKHLINLYCTSKLWVCFLRSIFRADRRTWKGKLYFDLRNVLLQIDVDKKKRTAAYAYTDIHNQSHFEVECEVFLNTGNRIKAQNPFSL